MLTKVILTVIGSDRPGLTEALAAAVLDAGGNWLESRLSRLGGKYVGSVLVELPADGLSALRAAAGRIDAVGLKVEIVAADGVAPLGTAMAFSLVGQDRPGIVREVSAVLARLAVNIEDLETGTEDEAWSGNRLFRAEARLLLPPGVEAGTVQDALEAISSEIMVDFKLAVPG
ncbi:glycine cleavage system protein R [Sandarakinorhabdus sp. DWP1-3-1]|uniref:glycine cleavage system protein R n=1 Tax=Sandarakinorhabdus sp. DWP1-3-1 TaxID=2804627 RepID=UPI003CFA97E8